MTLRYSLIVPAYNEEALLPRLLESVAEARRRFRGGAEAVEVIVADNGSTDATAEIARRAGCRVQPVARRCIAAARNGGAAAARGEVLCFVDADSIVHAETFNVVEATLDDTVVGGATGAVPERWSLGLRVTYALMWPAMVLWRLDSGVVFCRRSDFETVGGYDEGRLFAEDVVFLLALRACGRRRAPRRRLARPAGAKTLTSARKFDKHGEWHFLRMGIKHAFLMKLRPQKTQEFARAYWYDER